MLVGAVSVCLIFVLGKSKKKAKHSAAESLLSLVEGVDSASLYVLTVNCYLQSFT